MAPSASASAMRIRLTWISMLLTSFIAMPWPMAPKWVIAEVIDFEDRPGSLKGRSVAADVGLQRALLGALLHAGDRRVDDVDLLLGELLVHPPDCDRIDGAHADDHVAGLSGLDESAGADDHFLGLRGRVDHRYDPARAPRDIGRAGAGLRAEADEPLELLLVDVVDDQRMALLQNVLGHRATHHPETDESDGLLSRLVAHEGSPAAFEGYDAPGGSDPGRLLQNGLAHSVRVQALGAAFTTDAALLHAAEGRVGPAGTEVVDGHHAAFQLTADALRVVQ